MQLASHIGMEIRDIPAFHPRLPDKAVARLIALDETKFLNACHQILLGRRPEPREWQSSIGRLRAGISKEALLCDFLAAPEMVRRTAEEIKALGIFIENAGTLDFSLRDFLNQIAMHVNLS